MQPLPRSFIRNMRPLGYDLSKFPVINKNIIKENQESFYPANRKIKS